VARREPVALAANDSAKWLRYARFPSFSGRAATDVVFTGFLLATSEVRGLDRTDLPSGSSDDDAGWYVVFQEQPTEPRFGPPPVGATPDKSEELAKALLNRAFRLFVHARDLVSTP
jgi:hypothetical protein